MSERRGLSRERSETPAGFWGCNGFCFPAIMNALGQNQIALIRNTIGFLTAIRLKLFSPGKARRLIVALRSVIFMATRCFKTIPSFSHNHKGFFAFPGCLPKDTFHHNTDYGIGF
jgi:hypothetical protein